MEDLTSRGKVAKSTSELDLYGDLVNSSVGHDAEALSRQLEEQKARNADIGSKYRRVAEDNDRLQGLSSELSKQNTSLQMNISCLFKTAKLEIDRKDREILTLRSRLEALGKVAADLRASNDVASAQMQQMAVQMSSMRRTVPVVHEPDVQPATPADDMALDSCDDRPVTPARHEMTPDSHRRRGLTESSDWSICSSPKKLRKVDSVLFPETSE